MFLSELSHSSETKSYIRQCHVSQITLWISNSSCLGFSICSQTWILEQKFDIFVLICFLAENRWDDWFHSHACLNVILQPVSFAQWLENGWQTDTLTRSKKEENPPSKAFKTQFTQKEKLKDCFLALCRLQEAIVPGQEIVWHLTQCKTVSFKDTISISSS